jgi:hypothetical protein
MASEILKISLLKGLKHLKITGVLVRCSLFKRMVEVLMFSVFPIVVFVFIIPVRD